MLDKRNLEQILSDQQEELEIRRGENFVSSTRRGADRLGQYAGSGRDRCAP